jgi:hypothetical protein
VPREEVDWVESESLGRYLMMLDRFASAGKEGVRWFEGVDVIERLAVEVVKKRGRWSHKVSVSSGTL